MASFEQRKRERRFQFWCNLGPTAMFPTSMPQLHATLLLKLGGDTPNFTLLRCRSTSVFPQRCIQTALTSGHLWSYRWGPTPEDNSGSTGRARGCVVDIREWAFINGRVPHRNLPHAGDRISIVLFTHSAAAGRHAGDAIVEAANFGFPVPPGPIACTPSLDELKFINMGMGPAAIAYRLLCESTLAMADNVIVPDDVEEKDVTQSGAAKLLEGKTVHFLHRSLLMGLFYAALVLGSLKSATAVHTASVMSMCGHDVYEVQRMETEVTAIGDLTTHEWHPCDAHIGDDFVPSALLTCWMPELTVQHEHLEARVVAQRVRQ